jgi:hypothetical protein
VRVICLANHASGGMVFLNKGTAMPERMAVSFDSLALCGRPQKGSGRLWKNITTFLGKYHYVFLKTSLCFSKNISKFFRSFQEEFGVYAQEFKIACVEVTETNRLQ